MKKHYLFCRNNFIVFIQIKNTNAGKSVKDWAINCQSVWQPQFHYSLLDAIIITVSQSSVVIFILGCHKLHLEVFCSTYVSMCENVTRNQKKISKQRAMHVKFATQTATAETMKEKGYCAMLLMKETHVVNCGIKVL